MADPALFALDEDAWNALQESILSPPPLPEAIVKLLANPSILEHAPVPTPTR